MSIPVSVHLALCGLVLAALPASAQLSGGVSSSNSANQSFQMQNQIRGIQQQQTFQNNQMRLQSDRNWLYGRPASSYAPVRRRR